jgi:hypothetical protein
MMALKRAPEPLFGPMPLGLCGSKAAAAGVSSLFVYVLYHIPRYIATVIFTVISTVHNRK